MNDLKLVLNKYFNWLIRLGIILIILSSFFLFTNLTSEFYDIPKFLVLLAISGILLVLITLRFNLNNKVVLIRTPLDIPLLLLLTVAIVSTVLSSAPFVSLLGNQLKIHSSLTSLTVYIIFYFILVNSLKTKDVRQVLFLSTVAAVALSAVTLLAYGGVKILPSPWSHGTNFTPTGSSLSTTAVLAMLIPIVASQILSVTNPLFLILNSIFLTLFGITIALTGNLATWIASAVALSLTLLISRFFDNIGQIKPINLIALIGPIILIGLVSLLSFIPPLGSAKNPLYTQAKNFPKEVQLNFIPSWKISVSSFRDRPFWGSGPATYLFDFTNYKPIEFNSTKSWNLRFDSAFNEYLQVLANLGAVGLIALLSLTALFISSAYGALTSKQYEPRTTNHELNTPLAISGLVFFVVLALHSSTLVLWVFGLLILASFMVSNLPTATSAKSWSSLLQIARNVSSGQPGEETIKVDALPSVLLTVSLGMVLFAFFFAGKYTLADYHHRVALNAIAQNQGVAAYNELVTAEKLNPVSDFYRIDLAQTNFALANAIAQAKAPTEASPAGFLTDQDKQNIQVLLQQSINEARSATTLSPRSALNWEILGLLYRQISGVATNGLVFSLDSYGKAIAQDPLNPNLRLNVGGVYYVTRNFDLAIRFFTDSINLKPDFANGYYNLSVALRDKGDLTNAQSTAEKVLTLVEKDSPDYKVANDYLTDLKNRIASGSAGESQIKPPASQTSGALQKEALPKVVNVGNPPEKIATPAAVKKPNTTPEPTASP